MKIAKSITLEEVAWTELREEAERNNTSISQTVAEKISQKKTDEKRTIKEINSIIILYNNNIILLCKEIEERIKQKAEEKLREYKEVKEEEIKLKKKKEAQFKELKAKFKKLNVLKQIEAIKLEEWKNLVEKLMEKGILVAGYDIILYHRLRKIFGKTTKNSEKTTKNSEKTTKNSEKTTKNCKKQ